MKQSKDSDKTINKKKKRAGKYFDINQQHTPSQNHSVKQHICNEDIQLQQQKKTFFIKEFLNVIHKYG